MAGPKPLERYGFHPAVDPLAQILALNQSIAAEEAAEITRRTGGSRSRSSGVYSELFVTSEKSCWRGLEDSAGESCVAKGVRPPARRYGLDSAPERIGRG